MVMNALGPRTEAERRFDLSSTERLGCQAAVVKSVDLHVYMKSAGDCAILSEAVRHRLEIDPAVRRRRGV